jgi:outer membrane protein TolC
MSFVMGDRQVGTVNVSLLVPVYTFGRVSNQGEAEKLRVNVAELNADRARQDLELAVKQAYYRILEAGRIKEVVEESIRVVERQVEISRDFLSQGLVAKNDVLISEVQLAQRKEQLIQAENNIQLATATLNRLMGLEVDRPTRIADVLEATPWNGTFKSALLVAMENRPDLRARRRQVEIAQAEFRATRAGLFPYLYATGEYSYSSDSFFLNDDWLTGGVVLEIPLFELPTHMKIRRKKREIAEALDLHDSRADDIVLEVKQAYLNLREAVLRIPVARKSIEQGEENLRMVRDQYSQGLVTSTDVLIEEERRSQARVSYYRSLYDYHQAFARLTNVIAGKPPEE